jgi:hypothetical protein
LPTALVTDSQVAQAQDYRGSLPSAPNSKADVERMLDKAAASDPKANSFRANRRDALAALYAYIFSYRLENKNPSDQAKTLGPLLTNAHTLISAGGTDQETLDLAWDLFRSFKSFPYDPKQDASERAFVKEVLVDSLFRTLLTRMREIDGIERDRMLRKVYEWIGPQFLYGELSTSKFEALRDPVFSYIGDEAIARRPASNDLQRFLEVTERVLTANESRLPENWYALCGVELVHRLEPCLTEGIRQVSTKVAQGTHYEKQTALQLVTETYCRVRYCERCLDSIERPNSIGPRYTEAEIVERRKMLRVLRQQLEAIVDGAVASSASAVTTNGAYRVVPNALEQLTELLPQFAPRIPELCERICRKVEERLDAGKADLVTKGELATLLLALTPQHDVALVTKRLARLEGPLLRDGDAVLLDTTTPGSFNPIRRADPIARNPPATLMIPSMALQERLGAVAMRSLFRELVAESGLQANDLEEAAFLKSDNLVALHALVRGWREFLMEEFEPTLHWHQPPQSPFQKPQPSQHPRPTRNFVSAIIKKDSRTRTEKLLKAFGYTKMEDALIPGTKRFKPDFHNAYYLAEANRLAFLGGMTAECLALTARLPRWEDSSVAHPYWRGEIVFELQLAARVLQSYLFSSVNEATRFPGAATSVLFNLAERDKPRPGSPLHYRPDLLAVHRVFEPQGDVIRRLHEANLQRTFLKEERESRSHSLTTEDRLKIDALVRTLTDGQALTNESVAFTKALDPARYDRNVVRTAASAKTTALLAEFDSQRRLYAYARIVEHDMRRKWYAENYESKPDKQVQSHLCRMAMQAYETDGQIPSSMEARLSEIQPLLYARLCRYPREALEHRMTGTPILSLWDSRGTLSFLYAVERELRATPDSLDCRKAKALAWKLARTDELTPSELKELRDLADRHPELHDSHWRYGSDRFTFDLVRGMYMGDGRRARDYAASMNELMIRYGLDSRSRRLFRFATDADAK